jgi:hypothetical protein
MLHIHRPLGRAYNPDEPLRATLCPEYSTPHSAVLLLIARVYIEHSRDYTNKSSAEMNRDNGKL